MPGSVSSFIWYLGTALELGFVVCSLVRRSFLRYFFLNLYFLLAVGSSVARHFILGWFGLASKEYTYAYFYTDALLTLALYMAVISLYNHVFGELQFSKYLRFTAVLLLVGTALVFLRGSRAIERASVYQLCVRTLAEPLLRWLGAHLCAVGCSSEAARNAYATGAIRAFPRALLQRLRSQFRVGKLSQQVFHLVVYRACVGMPASTGLDNYDVEAF